LCALMYGIFMRVMSNGWPGWFRRMWWWNRWGAMMRMFPTGVKNRSWRGMMGSYMSIQLYIIMCGWCMRREDTH
jgi:hypothetical protein